MISTVFFEFDVVLSVGLVSVFWVWVSCRELSLNSLKALPFAPAADELPDGVLGELLGGTPFVVLAAASAAGAANVRSPRTAQRQRKTRRRLSTRRAYRLPAARHALAQTVE
jgi:hypothetical protein